MRLQGCCGCFGLRQGTIAIGITLLVIVSLELSWSIGGTIYLTVHHELYLSWWFLLDIMPSVMHLAFSALLVYGARRDRRSLVLAWIVYHGIVSGLYTARSVMMFVMACTIGESLYLALTVFLLALVAVFWYWLVVVICYYRQMEPEASFSYRQHKDDVEVGNTEEVKTQGNGHADDLKILENADAV